MRGVLLDRPAARSIVVAPRLPERPRAHTGDPFTTIADVVLDCATPRPDGNPCGWHAMGSRADVKKAYDEHRKLYHSEEMVIVLLNNPSQ